MILMQNKIVAAIVILGLMSLIISVIYTNTKSNASAGLQITTLQANNSSMSNNFTLSITLNTTNANVNGITMSAKLFYSGSKIYTFNRPNFIGMSLGGCGAEPLIFSQQIYAGYYTAHNISGAKPLEIVKPEAASCLAEPVIFGASFEPESYNAIYNVGVFINHTHAYNVTVKQMLYFNNITGYWTGGPCNIVSCTFVPFELGIYTVEAIDTFNQTVIVHFKVVNVNLFQPPPPKGITVVSGLVTWYYDNATSTIIVLNATTSNTKIGVIAGQKIKLEATPNVLFGPIYSPQGAATLNFTNASIANRTVYVVKSGNLSFTCCLPPP